MMKNMKRLFYALMMAVAFLAQSCEKSEPGERGLIYNLGSEESLKMRRSNAMFFDGVKVVDIDKVYLESGTGSKGLKIDALIFSIDGSTDWELITYDDIDALDPMNNRAAVITLCKESNNDRYQSIKVFAQMVDGVRYSGTRFYTFNNFEYRADPALNAESIDVKCFQFYKHPQKRKKATLKAYISIKLKSGSVIDIVFQGDLSVLT